MLLYRRSDPTLRLAVTHRCGKHEVETNSKPHHASRLSIGFELLYIIRVSLVKSRTDFPAISANGMPIWQPSRKRDAIWQFTTPQAASPPASRCDSVTPRL